MRASQHETELYPELPELLRRYIPSLLMPAISTGALPTDVRPAVQEAYREVASEPRLPEEQDVGTVHVRLHRNPPYAGVTRLDPYRGTAEEVGINDRLPRTRAKRVAKHELRHVKSSKLLQYADIPEQFATLVMETYAEYGGVKSAEERGNVAEAKEIVTTTPYPQTILFGTTVDRHYFSNHDGRAGYKAFIRDIFRNRSMRKTFERLAYCMDVSRN